MLRSLLLATVGLVAAVGLTPEAQAADQGSGLDALEQFRKGKAPLGVVQNRFFLKKERFELAPQLGYVPNNPFAQRFVGGVLFGYHFSEQVSAQAQVQYSPDLGERDLKGLTKTLVQIAQTSTTSTAFQQPLDKVTLGFTAAVCWAPFYGKINLIGEKVLNFDMYGVAGFGLISKKNYFARWDPDRQDVGLTEPNVDVKVGPVLGAGLNFFLNQTVALKVDLRSMLYVGKKPQYDPDIPEEASRLYNHMVVTAGVGFFFPKMKPRIYNF